MFVADNPDFDTENDARIFMALLRKDKAAFLYFLLLHSRASSTVCV